MRKTIVIDAFPDSAFRHRHRDAVACVDVMLATTTLVTAATQGRQVFVARDRDEVRALRARLGNALVVGWLEGAAAGEFELPDSPCAVLQAVHDHRPVVLASSPGTDLLLNAAEHAMAFVAAFRNLSATADSLARHNRVAILAAGCREEFSCEDQMAAAWIAERLLDRGFEAEDPRTAGMVRRWSGIPPSLAGWGNSAAQLRREGRGADVDFVIDHVDDVDQPFTFDAGELREGSPVVWGERGEPA